MTALVAIIHPACDARLNDIFRFVSEVAIGERSRETRFVIGNVKLERGLQATRRHPSGSKVKKSEQGQCTDPSMIVMPGRIASIVSQVA